MANSLEVMMLNSGAVVHPGQNQAGWDSAGGCGTPGADSMGCNCAACAAAHASSARNAPAVIELGLRRREMRVLDSADVGTEIVCSQGVLWVTQARDPDDHVLRRGDRFTVTRRGRVIAQGM